MNGAECRVAEKLEELARQIREDEILVEDTEFELEKIQMRSDAVSKRIFKTGNTFFRIKFFDSSKSDLPRLKEEFDESRRT